MKKVPLGATSLLKSILSVMDHLTKHMCNKMYICQSLYTYAFIMKPTLQFPFSL